MTCSWATAINTPQDPSLTLRVIQMRITHKGDPPTVVIHLGLFDVPTCIFCPDNDLRYRVVWTRRVTVLVRSTV